MPFPFTLKIYDDVETKESEQITGNSIRLWGELGIEVQHKELKGMNIYICIYPSVCLDE